MARAAETIDQRRFTVDEYHRMAEMGIFKPDERVELIRGLVHRMSPKDYAHVVAVTKIFKTADNGTRRAGERLLGGTSEARRLGLRTRARYRGDVQPGYRRLRKVQASARRRSGGIVIELRPQREGFALRSGRCS